MTDHISQLIPIRDHEGQQVASGRAIHAYLEVQSNYTTWFTRMSEYGFTEGQDFVTIKTPGQPVDSKNGNMPEALRGHVRMEIDHAVTVDMAKELGMIQRTAKGKDVRQYFIAAEKNRVAPTGQELIAQAVIEAQRILTEREATIAVLEPKADAYEAFLTADGTYSMGNAAKMLGRSQNKLFADLRNNGVLIAKGHMRNTPYQKYMQHFKVTPYSYERRDGTMGCSYTTTVQPSGIEFIRRRLGIRPESVMEIAS